MIRVMNIHSFNDRWEDLFKLKSPHKPHKSRETRNMSSAAVEYKDKVLVVGAGGIGCELLKNLVLTGFKDIHLVMIVQPSRLCRWTLI